MPSKPNYNHQRAERNRAKQAKKEEKLMAKKDNAARKAMQPHGSDEAPAAADEAGASPDGAAG